MSIWDLIPIPESYGVDVDRVRSNKIKYPPHTDIRKFCDTDCDFLVPSVVYYCMLMGFTIASFLDHPTTHGYFLGPFAVALCTCFYHNVKASFFLRTVAHMEVRQQNAIPPQVIASYYYRVVNVMFLLCCLAFIPMNLELVTSDERLIFLLASCSIPSIIYNIWGSVRIQQYGDAVIAVLQQQWNEDRMARAAAIFAQEIYAAEMEQIEMAENYAREQALNREPPPSYATGLLAPKPEDFEGDYIFENGGFRAETPPPEYHAVEMEDSDDNSDADFTNEDDDVVVNNGDNGDNGGGKEEDEDDAEDPPVEVIVISF